MTDKSTDPEVIIEEDLELPMDVDILEAKKEDDKPAEAKVEEEDPIAVLQRQLDEAKADAARAAQEAQEARKQAKEYETRVHHSNGQTIASQIDSVESAMELTKSRAAEAKRAYASALEIADYDAAAKAQEDLSAATYDMRTLEQGKVELQRRHKQASQPQPQRQAAPDTLEGFIDGIVANSSAQAQDYIKRNRASLKSERDVNRMIAAHQLAVLDHQPDSEGYFKAIDRQMGWGQAEERQAPQQQKKTVAAPVGRDVARSNGDFSERKVTLTPEERRFCDETGISYQAYGKNKLKIAANGKNPQADGLRFTNDIRS